MGGTWEETPSSETRDPRTRLASPRARCRFDDGSCGDRTRDLGIKNSPRDPCCAFAPFVTHPADLARLGQPLGPWSACAKLGGTWEERSSLVVRCSASGADRLSHARRVWRRCGGRRRDVRRPARCARILDEAPGTIGDRGVAVEVPALGRALLLGRRPRRFTTRARCDPRATREKDPSARRACALGGVLFASDRANLSAARMTARATH